MFCKNCGEPMEDSLKLCSKCGFKVDELKEVNIPQEQMSKLNTSTPSATNTRDYAGDLKREFNDFINYTTSVVKTPTMTLENINTYLTKNKALAYVAILAIFYSIIQCIILKTLFNAMVNAIGGFTSQLIFGFGNWFENGLYRVEPQWFKLFTVNVLFIIIFVCMLSLLSLIAYKIILKKNVELIDFVKLYLNSLVLLALINIFIMIAALINLKLMLAICLLGVLLYLTSIVINFVSYLKNETKVIYSLPVVIGISLYISYYMCFKIMY